MNIQAKCMYSSNSNYIYLVKKENYKIKIAAWKWKEQCSVSIS